MDTLNSLWNGLGSLAINALPTSPFAGVISRLQSLPALGWLNWFIPVGWIVDTMAVWLSAITIYYVYSVILRWVKVVR